MTQDKCEINVIMLQEVTQQGSKMATSAKIVKTHTVKLMMLASLGLVTLVYSILNFSLGEVEVGPKSVFGWAQDGASSAAFGFFFSYTELHSLIF